jgi:hypothetical protein
MKKQKTKKQNLPPSYINSNIADPAEIWKCWKSIRRCVLRLASDPGLAPKGPIPSQVFETIFLPLSPEQSEILGTEVVCLC